MEETKQPGKGNQHQPYYPLSIQAALLLKKLIAGETFAFSKIASKQIQPMIKENVLQCRLKGRTARMLYLPDAEVLAHYLDNVYGIKNLDEYIELRQKKEATRAENILITNHSKIISVRTFQGFLLNTFSPMALSVNGEERILQPSPGCFTFIYDYQTLQVPDDITLVGIENPANFRRIDEQKALFNGLKPLFVNRYPQSQHHDFIAWMQTNQHPYLHFGDLDLAGILIYQNEYLKKLGPDRCSFLVPESTQKLLHKYGNRELYDVQLPLSQQIIEAREQKNVQKLIEWIHTEHKGLEQEIFIKTS
ncbi:MAG: DUF2220 family protein [Bacteroides sp.]